MLKTFDPRIFPTAMSASSLHAATAQVAQATSKDNAGDLVKALYGASTWVVE